MMTLELLPHVALDIDALEQRLEAARISQARVVGELHDPQATRVPLETGVTRTTHRTSRGMARVAAELVEEPPPARRAPPRTPPSAPRARSPHREQDAFQALVALGGARAALHGVL